MGTKFKSNDEILNLAAALKKRRETLGYTLKYIEKIENINCSQLSRFENGNFKTHSTNLQKYCNFLQISEKPIYQTTGLLGKRIEEFAARSSKHREAAEEFLKALEHLP